MAQQIYFSLLICLMMAACGKEVNHVDSNQDSKEVSSVNSYTVNLLSSISKSGARIDQEYTFKEDLEVLIPERIFVVEGNAGDQVARVYFNVDDKGLYAFYCEYKGGANTISPLSKDEAEKGKNYHFQTCFQTEDESTELNYSAGYHAIQYGGKSILLSVLGADPRFDTHVESQLEVIYH